MFKITNEENNRKARRYGRGYDKRRKDRAITRLG